jgi:fimbrial isopeptide formation D2 family protein/LPXTG-motif cell wall-anchored protein
MVMALAGTALASSTDGGSITISNAEVGKTYDLYKLFGATVSPDGKTAYTTNATSFEAPANAWFDVQNGYVIKKDAFTAETLKTDAFKAWAESFGTKIGETVTASTSTVAWNGLDYGYYYIKTNSGASVTVDSANPNATVIDKNQTVSFDKNIVEGTALTKVNEAGLKEDVPFNITVNAKNYEGEDKVFKYVIDDTMDAGFSLKAAPVVTIGGETKAAGTDYTITYKKNGTETTTVTEADSFEITINWTENGTKDTAHKYDANAVIEVTYTAILDPAKAASVNVGATANKNEAEVKYYKGNDSDDDTPPSGQLGKKTTETFDTKLTVNKVDGENQPLTGAEFTLTTTDGTKLAYVTETTFEADANGTYYLLKDGTYTSEAPNDSETHNAVYASTTQKYKMVTINKVIGEGQTPSSMVSLVDANGHVTFSGLGAGTYTLSETKVPAGYNKADDVTFTITFDKETKKFASNNADVTLDSTNNVFATTVVNQAGAELPSTGGIGTTIFYVAGIVLVLGAAAILVARRKVEAE